MIENAQDLAILAKGDDESVGDGGLSDAEGEGSSNELYLREVLRMQPSNNVTTITPTSKIT